MQSAQIMKNIFFVSIIIVLLYSCKHEDIQSNKLIGSWNLASYKSEVDVTWQEVSINTKLNAIFKPNGTLGTNEVTPFGGGWCNVAEKYTLTDNLIHFEFGEAQCIPLIDPRVPSEAKIIELSGNVLLIQWGTRLLKFRRS